MTKQYKIYPKVQHIKYLDSSFQIGDKVNLLFDDKLDQVTKNKAQEVLKKNNIEFKIDSEAQSNITNIVLLIKDNENHLRSRYLKDFDSDRTDAYQISIKEKMIFILGKDTDAVFYGLVTLDHILGQIDDGEIEELTLNDYADQEIRGIIEGYYGIPWGNENRKDLLEFGGKFKNNAFVFAPKDDPYHRERWRDLYPQEELEEFKLLAEVGNKNKNRFVWTISPYQNEPITPENIDKSLEDLIKKFEQLYSVGIRQFGILGDDVGVLPYETVVKSVNAVSDWIKSKEDKVYDLIFVPQNYTLGDWGNRDQELRTYQEGLADNVLIVFTGEQVLAPVTQDSIDKFKNGLDGITLRDPLFWLNWPVNDIDRNSSRRLYMGKGSMLEKGAENLKGVLTNPLEEAHANYPAIFAVADYTWNTGDFDAQQSWEDSFDYIDEKAGDELRILATHMASMDHEEDIDSGEGISGLEESEDLNLLNIEFFETFDQGRDLKTIGEKLILEYKNIGQAVDGFISKSENKKMVKDLKPYILNLKEKSLAAVDYIQIILDKNNNKDTSQLLKQADEKLSKSKDYMVETRTSEFPSKKLRAESGSKYLNKHIKKLSELAR